MEPRRRIRRALRDVARRVPALSGLARRVEVLLDPELETAAIDVARLRLAISPAWCARLDDHDLAFVLAHELMHARQGCDRRAPGARATAWNYACDGVINRTLTALLGAPRGAGGVVFDDAIDAETAYLRLRQGWTPDGGLGRRHERRSPALDRARARDQARAGSPGDRFDFSQAELADGDAIGERALIVQVAPVRPWPDAWQHVGGARRERSYLRPSRRGDASGAVLAGRHRRHDAVATFVIPVVPAFADAAADTLGRIRAYAEDHALDQLRLVGCDEDGVILDDRIDVAVWTEQRLPALITILRIDGGRWVDGMCLCPGCGRPHGAPRAARGPAALDAAPNDGDDAIVIPTP